MFDVIQDSQASFSDLISPSPYKNQPFSDSLDPFNSAFSPLNSSALSINYDLGGLQISSETDSNLIATVQEAAALAKDQLTGFALQSDFYDQFGVAFGENYNQSTAELIQQQLAQGDLSQLPEIKVISSDILGNANGAYAHEIQTIFLSDQFVRTHNTQQIAGVLTEEIGHYLDSQVNTVDSSGDEGEIFAGLVQGRTFSSGELARLKSDDDNGFINFKSQSVAIESNDSLGTAEWMGTLSNAAYYRRGWVGANVPNDFYRFNLANTSNLSLSLTGLGADVDVKVLNSNGTVVIGKSENSGTSSEYINLNNLGAGQYYLQINRWSGDSRNSYYDLSLNATAVGNHVSFYEHDRYLGNSMTLGEGNYTYVGNSWNDRISAMYIPQGWTVEAFEHDNYQGQSTVFSGANSYVGNTWNDSISSVRIYRDRAGIVSNFYRDILGRNPDQGGLNSYVGNNWTLAQIRSSIGHSGEANGLVSNIYRDVLGRNPDQGGLNSYLDNLGNGWSLANVRYSISHSGEANGLVSNLYRSILGREPDQGGLNSYLNNLGNNWSLANVRSSIGHSEEARGLVSNAYSQYLGRVPDGAGLQSYLDAMGNNSTLASVRSSIANSYEASKIQQTGQWRGEYFNNRSLSGYSTFARIDGSINNDWGLGSPGGGVGSDNFSVRWTGKFDFGSGGNYLFHTLSDDGIRLWVDGNLAIDQWNDHGTTPYDANRYLSGVHQIKVEYYENGGGAVAKVWWKQTQIDNAGNTLSQARNLGTLNGSPAPYTDWVGSTDTQDYYRFDLSNQSNFSLSLTGLSADADVQLINSSGGQIAISEKSGTNSESISTQLSAGTYYVRVYPWGGANTNYGLSLNATPALPPDNAGNTLSQARSLGTLNGSPPSYSDWVGSADTQDYYRFDLSNQSNFSLSLTGLSSDADVQLLNSSGSTINSSDTSGSNSESINTQLGAGTYFVRVYQYSGNTNYNLNLSGVSLSGQVEPGRGNVNLWRYNTSGRNTTDYINPNQQTVVVIHGWNNNDQASRIERLAREAAESGVQVLALDWGSIANTGRTNYEVANWITPVAQWTRNVLSNLGIAANRLTLIGHSLGSYVASEIGRTYGQVRNLVALDPAYPARDYLSTSFPYYTPGYDIDINTSGSQRPVRFDSVAQYSLSFVVGEDDQGLAGDNEQAATARDSFIIGGFTGTLGLPLLVLPNDTHGAVIDIFRNALDRGLLNLNNLSGSLPNHIDNWYDDNGDQDNIIDRRLNHGRHEGTIYAQITNIRNGTPGFINSDWRITGLDRVVSSTTDWFGNEWGTVQRTWT